MSRSRYTSRSVFSGVDARQFESWNRTHMVKNAVAVWWRVVWKVRDLPAWWLWLPGADGFWAGILC